MKYFLNIALLWFSFGTFAQEFSDGLNEVKTGKGFSTSRKSNFSGFIGKNEQTLFLIDYLAINRKKQELKLRRLDPSTLELIDSKELFSVINPAYYNEPAEIFYQNNTVFLFSVLNGLKSKYNLIYLEVFNQYGEKLNERVVDTLGLDETYTLTESIEKKGFLLATHNKFDAVYEQSIELYAINEVGATEWQTKIKSPVSLQNLSIEKVIYSIEAPLYILCDYGFDQGNGNLRDNNTDLINNKFALWGYNHSTKFLKEFDLRLKNRWINGVGLAYNSSKDVVITGFMNETRNQSINGVFSLLIDPNLTVKTSSYYKYKKPFFEKFVTEKRLDKVKELEDIEFKECIVLADDSYFVIGEHYYQYTERNYDPRTNVTSTIENYNYNSIIIAYFDANGNHLWTDRIPKFQHTVNDYGYYSSFSVMQSKNELFFFFNGSEKNNELELDDYFNYHNLSLNRRFQLTYVVVGQKGIKKRGMLVDTKNNYLLRAKQCHQIDPNTFYLYGEYGKSRKVFAVEAKMD